MSQEITSTSTSTPLAAGQEFAHQLSAWLEQWGKGTVRDQHATYLDRLVKSRVDAALAHAPAKAKAARSDGAIINAFLTRYLEADQSLDVTDPNVNLLERIIRRSTAEREEFDAVSDGNGDMMPAALAELEQRLQRAQGELARAHDWRYNLESHAREAHQAVRECLVANKSPTKEGMAAILSTLRDGIEWTP